MYNSKISGLGMYVPENVVTNNDLSKIMDTSDEWITERTGIKERRHIKKGDGNSTSKMGVKAAKIAAALHSPNHTGIWNSRPAKAKTSWIRGLELL